MKFCTLRCIGDVIDEESHEQDGDSLEVQLLPQLEFGNISNLGQGESFIAVQVFVTRLGGPFQHIDDDLECDLSSEM